MFIWHTESQSWLNSLTMRQMYCTVARETKLTLGVALCVKSFQEDIECMFQWGKGQNMQHFKGEGDGYFFESVNLEMKCITSHWQESSVKRIQLSFPSWLLVLCCLSLTTSKYKSFKGWNMAFYVSDFFPFAICSRCFGLHFQKKVNNSTRITRAGVQNAMHSHHTYCIKIQIINTIHKRVYRIKYFLSPWWNNRVNAKQQDMSWTSDVGFASSFFLFMPYLKKID